MCLAIPAKIVEKHDLTARVEVGGNLRDANLALLPDAQVGDYVLLHAGFAISRYDPDEARRTLQLWRELLDGTA